MSTPRSSMSSILIFTASLFAASALMMLLPPLHAQEESPSPTPATRPFRPGAATNPPQRFSGRGGFGGFSGGSSGFSRTGEVTPAEGPTCPLDATIYEVRLAADKIGTIDVDALTRAAATPADFEKALSALGTMRPLYRAHQSVRLAGDSIMIGTESPYITRSQQSGRGQNINSVNYRQTGAIFTFAGKVAPAGTLEVDLGIQASTVSEGTTEITTNIKAPVFRVAQLAHKGPAKPNEPFVVLSADAASPDPDGKAVACIARITLGAPSAPADQK